MHPPTVHSMRSILPTITRLARYFDYDLSPRARGERLKATYGEIPVIMVGSFLGSTLLVAILYPWVAFANLLAWYSLSCITNILVIGLIYRYYRSLLHPEHELFKLEAWLLLYGFLSGVSFGAMAILLYVEGELIPQFIILTWLYAIGALTSTIAIGYKPGFYLSIIISLLPITVRTMLEGDLVHVLMSITTIVYFVLVVYAFRVNDRILNESIRLRFEVTNLAENLDAKREEAERANRAKSTFIASASHDLRQPLHAQQLYIAELKHINKDQGCAYVIERLERSVHAMASLFDSILDLSKLDAQSIKPDLRHFELQTVFTSLENELKPVARQKSIELRFCPTSIIVHTDMMLISQILRNLISNAIRYTEHGKCLVGVRRKKNSVCIHCLDTGIGIPEEHLDRICDEYYQIGNPERDREKGTGLGLAIVRRIAQLLGTELQVCSIPGRGSDFWLSVSYGDREEISGSMETEHGLDDIANRNILVVDDDSDIRFGMEKLLLSWGCNVISAEDEEEAFEQLRELEFMPDAIISDYRLKNGVSGFELIANLRIRMDSMIPAMIITGDVSAGHLAEADHYGYPILHKPVAPAKLRGVLGSIISSALSMDQSNR